MSDQSTPEIDLLEAEAFPPVLPAAKDKAVWLPDAIQAVRDTDERVRDEMALTRLSYEHARREAFREAVEWWTEEEGVSADAVERFRLTFLSPDNPEGNA